MKEEERTQGSCLQVCTCTWVAYQCHMSDKSLKLLLRESVSVLLVLSNPRRQVATFRKKVILEKLEREEEKRRGWWGGGKRERKRGGDRRKRRGGGEKKRRGKVDRRRKRIKRVKRPRLPLVTHPNNMRGRHHTERTMQFSRVALSTSILKQLPTEPSLNHYAPNYLHVVFQLLDEGTRVKCSLLMWGIYIYVWNNTWHTIVQSTVSWETFEGENFHELVKSRFSRLLAFAKPKDTAPPNFAEKTFANSHITVKFAKVFSLESFLLYGIPQAIVCHALFRKQPLPDLLSWLIGSCLATKVLTWITWSGMGGGHNDSG